MSKNILEEALRIVDGDRGKFYGHPLDNHGNTAEFWASYLKRKFGVEINLKGRDVCLMMVLLKISRDANRPKEDNLLDICGYTRNAQMIDEERERRARPGLRDGEAPTPPLNNVREIEIGGKPELAE